MSDNTGCMIFASLSLVTRAVFRVGSLDTRRARYIDHTGLYAVVIAAFAYALWRLNAAKARRWLTGIDRDSGGYSTCAEMTAATRKDARLATTSRAIKTTNRE